MRAATTRLWTAALLSGALALAGCASDTAAVAPPAPTAAPTATPTVGLSVAITSIPTQPPKPRPTPTATRFVPPAGPWVVLSPRQGPPASRSITVIAGNLPARSPVTVSWSSSKQGAPLSLDVLTGPRGNLKTPFSVPAAPPGAYRVTVASQGAVLGDALYHVISRASLRASVQPTPRGDAIIIHGHHFLPSTKLSLVAYPLFHGPKPLVLGTSRSNRTGVFQVRIVTRKVIPGEYELRAYSVGTLAAQVAETFFEVTV